MLIRSIVIAAALNAATAASAEPSKPQVQQASQPSSRPIVLASAEAKPAPAAADQQAPAKRPRVARVTTCRCGDPIPQESDEQE